MLIRPQIDSSTKSLKYIIDVTPPPPSPSAPNEDEVEVTPTVTLDGANQDQPTPAQQNPVDEDVPDDDDTVPEKQIDSGSARKAWDLYKLTERIIGKSGVTMTAELVARVAIMVSR
jgi:hypothetical protein